MISEFALRIISVLLLLLSFGCQCDSVCSHYRLREQEWYADNGKIKVLSTTAMINDLVEQIGGSHVNALILIRGELDPHTYQMVKGDDEKLTYADLIFYNGLGLEHGPGVKKHLGENKNAYALGDAILENKPDQILHYNGQLDPHIWMDISLWSETIPYIVAALSEKDPVNAAEYKANGDLLMTEMKRAHEAVKNRVHRIPSKKRFLVTSHDAFNYFARAYLAADDEKTQKDWQKRFAAPEGLSPESQLSAADIQIIIDHMEKYDIEVIFPESNVSRDSIRKIVQAGREHGMNLTISTIYLYGDAMGPPGSDGDTYLKMVWHNAVTLAGQLSGEQ